MGNNLDMYTLFAHLHFFYCRPCQICSQFFLDNAIIDGPFLCSIITLYGPAVSFPSPGLKTSKFGTARRKLANLGTSLLTQDSDSVTISVVKREEQQECDGHDAASSGLEGRDTTHFKLDDPDVDQKRTKQHFAQRSRVRKLQYISELERNVSALQVITNEMKKSLFILNPFS